MSTWTWKGRRWAASLILAGSGGVLANEPPMPAAPPPGTAAPSAPAGGIRPYSEIWLEVRVNGAAMASAARLLQARNGRLLASAEELGRWRIRLPPALPALSHRDRRYYALDDIDGLEYRIDPATQVLLVQGRPDVFLPTRINTGLGDYSAPLAPETGGFLNYDLQMQQQQNVGRLDGFLELGMFNARGFGTSSFLVRGTEGSLRTVRLDTAWTADDPGEQRSLRLGDSISRPGAWGRSLRYGGLQWGSNFAIRPDLVAFPQPSIGGEAVLPSTVDLYVDNALRLSRRVPYGPFTIPNVPVVTGEGEVRVVVRDALGRESVVTQAYYASAGLLRPGLHDYTYEAGFVRRNFTLENDDYGRFFGAGTHRLGITDRVTGEVRAEVLKDQQTLGVGGSFLWPAAGIVNAALAASRSPLGNGALASAGIERQGRTFGFGFQTQVNTAAFTQLGLGAPQYHPRQLTVARANYASGGIGSVFASYVHQANRAQPDVDLVSVGYNVGLQRDAFLSLFAMRSIKGEPVRTVGITLTYSLGPRTSASALAVRQRDGDTPSFQLQQSLPQGSGAGYRVSATGGSHPRNEAGLFLQMDYGTVSLEAAQLEKTTAFRVGATGGVAILGGRLRLARRLDESFALVKVGDYPDVPVYRDNQPVARTDATGSALIGSLRPYQKNNISISQQALPLDAEIGALTMTVTPVRRSGSLVEFPVKAVRGALLRIFLDNGLPLPAGALVTVAGQDDEFPVALRGEAYVTGLASRNELWATWKGQRCRLDVELPRDAGPLPVIGPLACHGVVP
ncbi:MAG: fimbria/pilus outer membrane usher protein [Candidatus Bathyarchaeota archaeon]